MENYNNTIKSIHKDDMLYHKNASRNLTNLGLSKQIKDQNQNWLVNKKKKIKAKNLTRKKEELKITLKQFGKKHAKHHGRKGHVGNE